MSSQVHLGVFIGTQQQAQQEPASSTVHWLPCKAASSCDADVPRLFNATITNHPSSAAQGREISACCICQLPAVAFFCGNSGLSPHATHAGRDGSFSTSVHAPIQEACFRGRQLRGVSSGWCSYSIPWTGQDIILPEMPSSMVDLLCAVQDNTSACPQGTQAM